MSPPPPSPAQAVLPASVIELKDIFRIVQHQEDYLWEPFRDDVDIHRLYGDGKEGPSAALLRYRAEAPIPPHIHQGYEHILVLCGGQRDENGVIGPGTLRIHHPGTVHRGVGFAGTIVLAIYEKPVRMI